MAEQVMVIFAGTKGYLDDVEVADVSNYEQKLLDDARANAKGVLDAITDKEKIDDAIEADMRAFLEKFTSGFVSANKKAA